VVHAGGKLPWFGDVTGRPLASIAMHNDGTPPFEFWLVSPFNMKRHAFPFLIGMLQCDLSRSHAKKKKVARDDGKRKKKKRKQPRVFPTWFPRDQKIEICTTKITNCQNGYYKLQ
jgi:hypothetical protein